jgi:hypothetical protein
MALYIFSLRVCVRVFFADFKLNLTYAQVFLPAFYCRSRTVKRKDTECKRGIEMTLPIITRADVALTQLASHMSMHFSLASAVEGERRCEEKAK